MATISKKFGQFKQWTGEKFGSTGKTEASEDFKRLEEETERRREGIERIHSSLSAYVKTLDKKKVSKLDPLRGRHLPIESFGSSLLSQGRIIGETSSYGKNLLKAGDIQHRLAAHQLEFMSKAKSTYLMQLDTLIELIKEYHHLKKKLSNRRLDYDAKLNRVQKSKKERPEYEEEMKTAQLKYEETLNDMKNLMKTFSEKEAEIGAYLVFFLDAQLSYFQKNVEVLNESSQLLRDSLIRGTGTPDLYHNSMHSLSNSSLNGSTQSLPMVPKDAKNGLYTPASLDEIKAKADQRASLQLPVIAPPAYSSSSIDGGASSGPTTSVYSHSTVSSSSQSSRPNGSSPPSLNASLLSNEASRVRVLYSFTKENEDELTIRKGESLSILEMVDEGWWIGKNESGQVGLFPSNYVEILPPTNGVSQVVDKKATTVANPASSISAMSNGSGGGKGRRGGEGGDEGEWEEGPIGSGGKVSQISESAPSNQNISNVNASYKEAMLERNPSFRKGESRQDLIDSIDTVIAQKGPLQTPATFHAKMPAGLASKNIGKSSSNGLGDMVNGISSQKNQPQVASGPCAECSCTDYSPNVFKAGSCNNCFHRH